MTSVMYQLVLQFRTDQSFEFETLVAIEERLIQVLGASAEVDGHDVGSGEANVFIRTRSPGQTFEVIKPVLSELGLLERVNAAYRNVSEEDYAVIWPRDFAGTFSVA
jgi:hypothetical protein